MEWPWSIELLYYNIVGFLERGKSLEFHKSSPIHKNFTFEVFTTTIDQLVPLTIYEIFPFEKLE